LGAAARKGLSVLQQSAWFPARRQRPGANHRRDQGVDRAGGLPGARVGL